MISLPLVVGGGLEKDIKSGKSSLELFFFCEEGGGAINAFEVFPACVPGLGRDLLDWRSYLTGNESFSFIDEALITEIYYVKHGFMNIISSVIRDLITQT